MYTLHLTLTVFVTCCYEERNLCDHIVNISYQIPPFNVEVIEVSVVSILLQKLMNSIFQIALLMWLKVQCTYI